MYDLCRYHNLLVDYSHCVHIAIHQMQVALFLFDKKNAICNFTIMMLIFHAECIHRG